MKKELTVITPTYNRGYILNDCYRSLKEQTNMRFIWTIIDDGSTDNTEELVQQWKEEELLEVRYYKKDNGGKASALNYAFDVLDTKYWVCLDSDDTFSYNAIEMALERLSKIENDTRYCGILALRTKKNGIPVGGKRIPEEVKEATLFELATKYKLKTEYIEFYTTNITKAYRFPIIPGEKFISPAYLSHELNKEYKFIVDHNTYCYCEYLADGLTKNKLEIIKKNPVGYTLIIKQGFEKSEGFFNKSKRCIKYISGSMLSGDENFIKNSPHKLMTTLYYPVGWLAYKIRFRNK